MWRGGSQYNDSYTDTNSFSENLYNYFLYQADNIQQIYRDEGLPVPEYPIHANNNNNHTREDNHASSGITREPWHASDEALARYLQLQEIENDFQNFSFDDYGPFRTGREGGSNGEGTYEEISELEQSIGSVKQNGLSEEQISCLPTHKYKGSSKKKGQSTDDDSECVICKMQYDKGDLLMTLPCAHKYHQDCIQNWLKENKSCCICKVEVSV